MAFRGEELRCRFRRTQNMPPARRYAPRCPPNSTSFVGGRPRDVFGAVVRFWVPSCNSLQKSKLLVVKRQRGVGARGKPPNLGVAMNAVKSGGHVTRSARPASKLLSAKRQPQVEARVSPLSREASDGGAKTRRHSCANARWPKESSPVQECRRVLGGRGNY